MSESRETVARVLAECEKAGVVFGIDDGRLTVSFHKLDWRVWPELKMTLENMQASNLITYLESAPEFGKAVKRSAWCLVSRSSKPLKVSRGW